MAKQSAPKSPKKKSTSGKGKKRKGSYSLETKMATLLILKDNGGNYNQTFKDTGISRVTLKKWQGEFGARLNAKESVALQVMDSTISKKEEFKKEILPMYYDTQRMALQRAQEIIPFSTSLDHLMKVIETISKFTPGEMDEDRGDTNINLYQIINQQLEKQQKDEKKTITINGDTEERSDK